MKDKKLSEFCIYGGCDVPRGCARCGFNREEDARRKELPLTLCKDGLRRKIIPIKLVVETKEK